MSTPSPTAVGAGETTAPRPQASADVEALRALSEKATQGPWSVTSEQCDGSYGLGEDNYEGYLAYSIVSEADVRHGNPGVILESSNSTVGEIHEEHSEDGTTAWDDQAKQNTAFIVALVNAYRVGDLVRCTHVLSPTPPPGEAGRLDREAEETLRFVFRNVDSEDWKRLDDFLDYTGHGKFWRAVFAEVRTALATIPTQPAGGVETDLTAAARDVLAERRGQMTGWAAALGWTAKHEDEHAAGEMARAAACYAERSALGSQCLYQGLYALCEIDAEIAQPTPANWPWPMWRWNFGDRRHALVKASALILAEIERLDRATPPVTTDRGA